jgi:hypothetical protein
MSEIAFSATPESGDSPLSVQFKTFNVGSYLWNFRDGTTSTEQNPVHVFTNPEFGTQRHHTTDRWVGFHKSQCSRLKWVHNC